MIRYLIQFAAAALILTVGLFFANKIGRNKPKIEATAKAAQAPMVRVHEIAPGRHELRIKASGEMRPVREVTLTPQVSGKVVHISPELSVGGRFRSGQTMLRIDDKDYRIARRQAKNEIARAEVDIELEQGRGEVAQREWNLLADDLSGVSGNAALARREPQARAAQLALDNARARLDQAELHLSRTKLKAPFNATVVSETVEIGQVVGPTSRVATLVGTDALWARIRVPVQQLSLFETANETEGTRGSPAQVRQVGVDATPWPGHVERMVYELDSETRSAQLLVTVDNPFDPQSSPGPGPGRTPLLPGAFVEVEIRGRSATPLFAVPRTAIVDGNQVWRVVDGSKIEKRKLEVVWSDVEAVHVRSGVRAGDELVLDPPKLVIEGMQVRVHDESPPARSRRT